MYLFEVARMIQVRALAGGKSLSLVGQNIIDGIQAQVAQVTKGLGGSLAWPCLLRRLDRLNSGYDQ